MGRDSKYHNLTIQMIDNPKERTQTNWNKLMEHNPSSTHIGWLLIAASEFISKENLMWFRDSTILLM